MTTYRSSTFTPYPNARFVLVNDHTGEHLMPLAGTEPLEPLAQFQARNTHLALVRNPGFVDLPGFADRDPDFLR